MKSQVELVGAGVPQGRACSAAHQVPPFVVAREEKGNAGKLLWGEPNSKEEREGMDLVLPLSSSPPPVPASPFDGETENKIRETAADEHQTWLWTGCMCPLPTPPKSSPAVKHFRADRNHTQPSHNPICRAAFQ